MTPAGLDPEQERRLLPLVEEALGRPADEREAFVRDRCANDEPLRQSAMGMIARYDAVETVEVGEPAESSSRWDGFLDQLRLRGPAHTRYELEGELGRGGMGTILRVFDRDVRRRLAMKIVRTGSPDGTPATPIDDQTLGRFVEEAQITGQLEHPGIVPVHDVGVDGEGRLYFTMRMVRGQTLADALEQSAAGVEEWSEPRVLSVILRACEAMAFAHEKGVIHRDLKPANIMVGRFGETYVMDWGLARVLGREDSRDLRVVDPRESRVTSDRRDLEETPDAALLTMDGHVVGTPSYMSPEQAEGRLDDIAPATDVYAMGAILYQLLARRMPYVRPGARPSPYTVLAAVMQGPPEPIPSVRRDAPAELVAICEKAMAREIGDRYPDMSALAADLGAFLEQRVVRAYEAGAWATLRKWVVRNKALATTAALAMLAVLALSAWAFKERAQAEQSARTATRRAEDAVREKKRADEQATLAARRAEEAEDERDAKVAALHRSEGLRLIAQSRASGDEDPALALALCIEGARRAPGRVADEALIDRLQQLRERATIRCRGEVVTMAYDPDTRRLLVGGAGFGGVIDVAAGEELAGFDLWPGGGSIVAARWIDGQPRLVGRPPDAFRFRLERETGEGPFRDLERRPALFDGLTGGVAAWLGPAPRLDDAPWPDRVGAFDRDAKQLYVIDASASSLSVFGVANGEPSARIEHPEDRPFSSVAVHPDGAEIAVGDTGLTVRVLDAATGDELATQDLPGIEGGSAVDRALWQIAYPLTRGTSGPGVLDLAYDARGERLAVASQTGYVRVLDGSSLAVIHTLEGTWGEATAVAFSARGFRLAAGYASGVVVVWRPRDGVAERVLRGHSRPVTALEWVDGGRTLISGSRDATARVWDVHSTAPYAFDDRDHARGHPLSRTLEPAAVAAAVVAAGGHVSWTRVPRVVVSPDTQGLVFSADGKRMAAESMKKGLVVLDVATRDVVASLQSDGRASDLSLSSTGTRVAARVDRDVFVWDVDQGATLFHFTEDSREYSPLALSDDGRRLALVRPGSFGKRWSIDVLDVDSGERITRIELEPQHDDVAALEFAPDGDHLLVGTEDDGPASLDGVLPRPAVTIYELKGGERKARDVGLGERACYVAGGRYVVASAGPTLSLLDGESLELRFRLTGHAEPIVHVGEAGGGRYVLSSSRDGVVRVWPVDPLDEALRVLSRALTEEERARYQVPATP